MGSLKVGQTLVGGSPIPECDSCYRRGYVTRDCLCCGTGAYYECDSCGTELIGGYHDDRCNRAETVQGAYTICSDCIDVTVRAEIDRARGRRDEPDYHIPSSLRSAS